MNPIRLVPLVLLASLATAAPQAARADTTQCIQVTSLPATLGQQGVYCLKSSLAATSAASNLVGITANNVTLDCNGHSISQLGTGAVVIQIFNSSNVTIRNCTTRGAVSGIHAYGTGHLLEGNQIVGAERIGIYFNGASGIVRRNRILGIGGKANSTYPGGIVVSGRVDVLDNTIAGVVAGAGTGHQASGIEVASNPDGDVSGNRISGVLGDGMVGGNGIRAGQSLRLGMRGNVVIGNGTGVGISCTSDGMGMASDNRLLDTGTPIALCREADNLTTP